MRPLLTAALLTLTALPAAAAPGLYDISVQIVRKAWANSARS